MSNLDLVFGGTPPQFIDDSDQADGQNGQPATARIMANEIGLLNQLAHCGRPIYSWAMSSGALPIHGGSEITSCYRQIYMANNLGAVSEAGEILGLAHQQEVDPGYQTGQGFDVSIGTSTFHAYWNYSTSPVVTYPVDMRMSQFDGSYGFSTVPAEVIIGGGTSNWPTPMAGAIWQNPENAVDSSKTSIVGAGDVIPKKEIVGVRATGKEQLTRLTSVLRDTWFHQRPQAGWSTVLPGQVDGGTSAIRGVHFTTSSQAYRYIFDQSYGSGGTAITSTTPGITVPLANSAGGVRTQVRVYPFVYAAMSGGTDTGSIAIANRDSGGTMTTPTAVTNPITISGTTFQWYPTLATWAVTTAPYFLGYTGGAYDRVALCAKSSGATDHVIIGAFTFCVQPATS